MKKAVLKLPRLNIKIASKKTRLISRIITTHGFQQDDRDAHRRKMEILNANFNRGVAQAQKQIQAQKPPYQACSSFVLQFPLIRSDKILPCLRLVSGIQEHTVHSLAS